ncbi:MAG: hypothetical protein QW331_04285 [Candidatus Woesearchaeota archaeon]
MEDFNEDNFYAEEHRYELLDNDEITAEEEAWMAGHDEAEW